VSSAVVSLVRGGASSLIGTTIALDGAESYKLLPDDAHLISFYGTHQHIVASGEFCGVWRHIKCFSDDLSRDVLNN
jgi:hypothetical protein